MNVLYVCNDHAYFEAHRRWLVDEAETRGMNVRVACGGLEAGTIGRRHIEFPLDIKRHHFDAWSDMRLLFVLAYLAHRTKADVVHLITIKPILFGAIGLRLLAPKKRIIATFPGLGRMFDDTDTHWKAHLRRSLVVLGLKFGLGSRRTRAIVETQSDREKLTNLGVVDAEQSIHIPGAGVDPAIFTARPLPRGPMRLLFAGRLLKKKGVHAFAGAASLLTEQSAHVRFILAGSMEANDPDGLDASDIATLQANPNVEFMGHVPPSDMPNLLASIHAVILPTTYQEGIPRILIEASAVGRPCIVSDNPGCLAIVQNDVNGVVLAKADARHIADVVLALTKDREKLARMSANAVRLFRSGSFEIAAIADQTLATYS